MLKRSSGENMAEIKTTEITEDLKSGKNLKLTWYPRNLRALRDVLIIYRYIQ